MPDNISVPAAAGTVLAFDQVTIDGVTVLVARNKFGFGTNGEYSEVSSDNPLPVMVGLTDEELRAAPLPVAVDFPTEQAVSIADRVAVEGEFYPDTQPISAEALPLADGAATRDKQDENTDAVAKLGSAKRWFPITPDGNTDLATIPDAIYVGGAGDIVLKGSDGTNATFAVVAGQTYPFSPMRVLATGTTATGLIGLVS